MLAASTQPAARILVVEDDAAISDVACSALSKEGYACVPAYSGTEAKLLLSGGADPFDLVICDLMLPGMPGEEVVALLRSKGADVPVLVTSAKSAVMDRVSLLRAGADDYLVKPFDLDELIARVEALLRRASRAGSARFAGEEGPSGDRGPGADRGMLRYGAWEANLDARAFTAAGAPIRLTRTEFDILCTLMRHPSKVFTKRELYEQVWREDAAVEEKTVNTHVSNIRTKLKGTGTEGYIETVWGIGFKLADAQ